MKKRTRRTQERTEITRAKLLEAGTTIFSEKGFDGVSVRDIENTAEVQRGLLAYHFNDKENMWKAVVDATFGNMKTEFDQRFEILHDLSKSERVSFIVRFHVRFHAKHPELSRLMSQEATHDSWRIRYLIDHHIRPASNAMARLVKEAKGIEGTDFVNWYYIMVSASSTIFSFAPECQLLFDVDCHQESIVEAHADMLVAMLLGADK
ncbi:MAG: AcrR family transcriptional regulator [Oceanicoccus sp.]|jgi:AcrR family transcriptional regulator